ncbi:MAG: bifunctional phosphopantothenoylcysteine decarboxylase/phosphopantothenate--cysteine ligase CoaBC [Proteobacteria bacterium]|nr:bifunctional phosphopantothenoylcysteine decarboxylase/phosphopantothenate--cysteine ligase CoaBC [Pseudomonadota bacterium]MBU1640519.1 bifunctional phosphopantothenoylcysteine decarboxylase/phosphopantothenate--cysteine ligase CoaBC [Pseudomonadota bacterium]
MMLASALTGKKILLGVCGSIAAYKACDIVRNLRKLGAEVTVVVTSGGARFVSPLTFAALSAAKVYGGMFDEQDAHTIPHINLARDHDMILVAPATAQTIARFAVGMADDLLSAVVLAADCPVVVCPAMNSKMFTHPATQVNLTKIAAFGYHVVQPDSGLMACKEEGPGRLPEWSVILSAVEKVFTPQDLAGKRLLITAGPTEEPLDPVRYLSNRSSGKMGYALARAAMLRGGEVVLVSGPCNLEPPANVELIQVRTAQEMYGAVLSHFDDMDIVVKCAAVSDFRPARCAPEKLKKEGADVRLELAANRDILRALGERKKSQILVGFAAESENHLEEGKRKLAAKNLDMIVVNDIQGETTGFQSDTNKVTLVTRGGEIKELELLTKEQTAMAIFDEVVALVGGGM